MGKFGYSRELWAACHDEDSGIAATATACWAEAELKVPQDYLDGLLDLLGKCGLLLIDITIIIINSYLLVHGVLVVQKSAARALADAAQLYPSTLTASLEAIYQRYAVLVSSSILQL